jgi:hypothetical protein
MIFPTPDRSQDKDIGHENKAAGRLNVPDFDILAIDETLKRTIPLQVKTVLKGGGWQSVATKWMDIEVKDGYQTIRGKTKTANPNLIYVLVELGDNYGEDSFYLLRKRQLQRLYFNSYKKWLAKHGGFRPKKPNSLHCALTHTDFARYKDNWDILKET